MNAILTFPSHLAAKEFAIQWSRFSLSGYSLSAAISEVHTVTVYDMNQAKKEWIENYIARFEKELAAK